MKPSLVVCTGNPSKLTEIATTLRTTLFDVHGIRDFFPDHKDPEETGSTFHENASLKVQNFPVVANRFYLSDDSGLEVEALSGAPGIYSARYAGAGASSTTVCQKIIAEMAGHTNRRARFMCVLALLCPNGESVFFEGTIQGKIGHAIHGKNGFGYDPIFIPDGYDLSFSQLPLSVKQTISHRARALKKLTTFLFESQGYAID